MAREGVHSTEEYAAWDAKYDSWAEEAKEYIKNNEGHRAAGIFRRGSMMVVQRMQNAFNDDHNARLNILWEKISDLTTHYENAMDEKRIWAADK
ncbi:hypothetical protein GL4_0853 [Methyloceanibacter caenitepidi]|uniref:Uncharacterized protein n=1 Tax=Methyloceanibacter caenitepidi TaxID=1384459 RepID=A0A0A8K2V4_9HYPH|nr:hypothetical protein GL4_0853 [Methyloceanibacter caenitepidi]